MNVPIEIIVTVITAFFSIFGFGFLVIWQNTKAINSINVTLSELNVKENMDGRAFDNRHVIIDRRLSEHSSKLIAHSLLLTEHDLKIKELQK